MHLILRILYSGQQQMMNQTEKKGSKQKKLKKGAEKDKRIDKQADGVIEMEMLRDSFYFYFHFHFRGLYTNTS